MDSFSQMSVDSDDCIAQNVASEEIVGVESPSDVRIQEDDDDEDDADADDDDVPMASDEESESDDEMRTDEIQTNSRPSSTSSHLDETHSNGDKLDVHDDPQVQAASTPVQRTTSADDKISHIPTDEQKVHNLKLVLKKSPEYQLVSSPNSSSQKLILLANTSPTYSVTSSDGKKLTSSPTKAMSHHEEDTKESLDEDHEDADENLSISQDQSRPLKTYGRQKATVPSSKVGDSINTENQKIDNSTEKDDDDADSVKSDPDEKPSTPKITRELQQLQKTVNASKVLTEYINDSSDGKSRKTRKAKGEPDDANNLSPMQRSRSKSLSKSRVDSPISPENLDKSKNYPTTNVEDKSLKTLKMRSRSRSCSKPRVDSPSSENLDKSKNWSISSDDKTTKRQNMRSQNSEFVQKQIKFLNSIQAGGDDVSDNSDCDTTVTDGKSSSHSEIPPTMTKRELLPPPKPGWDRFCFKCQTGGDLTPCSNCKRSFHMSCVKASAGLKAGVPWICPECCAVESSMERTQQRQKTSVYAENLPQLLLFALKRMKQAKGIDNFFTNFSDDDCPDYSKYIVNPMSIEQLQTRIEEKQYKCTEEFAVDTKWILHNALVYFGNNSKITNFAKGVVKVCRQELTEIDTCPECYHNANTRRDWFVQVCSRPHILLWAKLKGFPYWPAKAMGIQGAVVNVRFFGDHDRANVPIKECFLYSETDPNPTKQNKRSIKECIKEVEIHIRKIITTFGTFVYPPYRTVYDPSKDSEQLEMMIPGINEFIKNAEKSPKPALTYKIVKSADNHLSIVKKDEKKKETTTESSKSSSIHEVTTTTPQSMDEEKVRKQRLKSSESNHSNDETTNEMQSVDSGVSTKQVEPVTSSSSATIDTKPAEKTVAPLKIQEQIDIESTTKTYKVVTPTVAEPSPIRVNSVILKRKSDNWNAVSPDRSAKRQKSQSSEDVEMSTTPNTAVTSETTKSASNPIVAAIASQQLASTYKRRRSRGEELLSPKQKIDDNKIPPLVLLTTPFMLASSAATLSTQSTVISTIPVLPSVQSTDVTVTITQSPVVTSASVEMILPGGGGGPNKSMMSTAALTKRYENSQIKIRRLSKKLFEEAASQKSASDDSAPASQTSTDKSTDSTKSQGAGELIPCAEIKTEREDPGENVVEVRSKTATPEQPTQPPGVRRKSSGPIIANGCDNFQPVQIKTENMSEDEDVSNASRSDENGDSENSTSYTLPVERRGTIVRVPSPVGNALRHPIKPETKQRARKSFPNRGNFKPIILTSQPNSIVAPNPRPILPQPPLPQNNGMVYIPVDPKSADVGKQHFSTSVPKAVINSFSVAPCPSASAAPPTVTVPTISSMQNVIGSGAPSPMNTQVAPLAPTILTTSVQLPLVYSTLPLPGVLNGQGMVSPQANGVAVQPNATSNITEQQHMLSGFVTPTLASAITEAIVRGPPKLAPKPSGPLRSESDHVLPTDVGPVTKMLNDNAHKMADFFRSVIEDTLIDMAKTQCSEARVRLLEMELEKVKSSHEKELTELKHNTDMMLCEMRKSMDNEKARLVAETRKQCEQERIRAVEEAKTKQWCASCGKEAMFYCCWNTSYCDYPCQQKHWSRHMSTCAQKNNADANAQRVGVKVAPYVSQPAGDKSNKSKELVSQKPIVSLGNRPVKIAPMRKYSPVATSCAIKRVNPQRPQQPQQQHPQPHQQQPSHLYTVINGNEWNRDPNPYSRVQTALIVSDNVTNTMSPKCSINLL